MKWFYSRLALYNYVMRRLHLLLITFGIVLLSACNNGKAQQPPEPQPTIAIVVNTLPAPVVTAEPIENAGAPSPTIEAEEPISPTASIPMSTPTAEPTAEPTPVPEAPIQSISLIPLPVQGLEKLTGLTHAFDERLFVLEQVGRIRIIENNELLPTPFLDIRDRVGSADSEQGLLGLAFHPDYATPGARYEGYFFVNYTDYSGNTHISRFLVSRGDPYRADPNSEVNYLTVKQPYGNHNGGSLAFGPDGYLYAGLGDGGSQNDPQGNGQNLSTLLGKVLRLDVDSEDGRYTVPTDNPFVGQGDSRPEIWAYGLRNPWRMSFDRATGDLYIADVGQNTYEEVNFQLAGSKGGENYGWSIMEGLHCLSGSNCNKTGLILPIFEYDHSQGCSISGGYVYRGEQYPEMAGNYFFSDYCSGTIWRLFDDGDTWVGDPLGNSGLIISSFGEDVHGELYVLNYWYGEIYRLTPGE